MSQVSEREPFEQERDALMVQLGADFETEREAQGLTVVEMARRAGLSKRCAVYLRKAQCDPKLSTVIALAHALGRRLVITLVAGQAPPDRLL